MFKWFHKKKNNHSKHLSELKEKLSIQELPHFDIEAIKQFALKDWELGETHGLPHWQRVERNGIILATLEVNITVIRLFAYLHDKCRIDNGYDVEHGKRAAIMIHEIRHTLLKELTDNEFELLFKACELHTTMLRTGNPTIDTCFDADRLDLERVEIRPTYFFDESCQGTVPESIIAFLESTDYESAIRLTISLGGDADTMGAITGGIAEAYYKEIPQYIKEEVLKRLPDEFIDILEKFYEKFV